LYTSSFLRVRIRPHLPSFHTALQTAHQITVGTRGRQALSWGPRMPTEPRSPYGTVWDRWMIYGLPWYQPQMVRLFNISGWSDGPPDGHHYISLPFPMLLQSVVAVYQQMYLNP
jgi:hypothetical protein